MKKEDIKVVKEEQPKEEIRALTEEEIKAEIEEVTKKGTALQKYIYSEAGKKESFALRRLRMEQFNSYCAIVECLQAQISILK